MQVVYISQTGLALTMVTHVQHIYLNKKLILIPLRNGCSIFGHVLILIVSCVP